MRTASCAVRVKHLNWTLSTSSISPSFPDRVFYVRQDVETCRKWLLASIELFARARPSDKWVIRK